MVVGAVVVIVYAACSLLRSWESPPPLWTKRDRAPTIPPAGETGIKSTQSEHKRLYSVVVFHQRNNIVQILNNLYAYIKTTSQERRLHSYQDSFLHNKDIYFLQKDFSKKSH